MANTIKIGSIEADGIKIGTSSVTKVYVGTELVYPTDIPNNDSPVVDDGGDDWGDDQE